MKEKREANRLTKEYTMLHPFSRHSIFLRWGLGSVLFTIQVFMVLGVLFVWSRPFERIPSLWTPPRLLFPSIEDTLQFHGTKYSGWRYNATSLTPNPIAYSVGIGEGISWDEWEMMESHGLRVWGFDPTPTSIPYTTSRHLEGRYVFTEEGLATKEGTATFIRKVPKNSHNDDGSDREGRRTTVDVTVNTLENWMTKNGHTHLDILKIDVKGAEYDLLEDWI